MKLILKLKGFIKAWIIQTNVIYPTKFMKISEDNSRKKKMW